MFRDECRRGHRPTEVKVSAVGAIVELSAYCDACGYQLKTQVPAAAWAPVKEVGYHFCHCRDCFELVVGVSTDLCDLCEEAGCEKGKECSHAFSYSSVEIPVA